MEEWGDKYKDLELDESAWYWTKIAGSWFPILVSYSFNGKYNNYVIQYHLQGSMPAIVREDFPNGPRCIMPEEI